jgi:serralysin
MNTDRWCFAWFAPSKSSKGLSKAALVKAAKWNPGDLITVSFLDGDAVVQDKIKRVAQAWTAPGMANLTFDFRNQNDTLIRISFKYSGSWSVVGTTCRQIADYSKPTMNFGWLTPKSSDDEILRVVLHEFGHALGLIHEHQNPSGGIKWNKDAVIRDLSGPPNNWSEEVIVHNMFEPYEKSATNYTSLDPSSIMMYPLPVCWTLDGFSAGLNSDLSATDRKFIHEEYP